MQTRRSGSSSSCSPTRASASTSTRRKRPSTRSSRASTRSPACRRSTPSRGRRSSSTTSGLSSRDARAAERVRVHDVSRHAGARRTCRSGDCGGRPRVLPLAYLLLRAAGGGLDVLEVLGRPGTLTLIAKTFALVAAVTGTAARRAAARLARRAHRSPGAPPDRDRGAAAARDPELRRRARAARRLRPARAAPTAAGATRRRTAPRDLRLRRCVACADALDLPLCLSAHRRGTPRARPALEDAARGLGRTRWGLFRR